MMKKATVILPLLALANGQPVELDNGYQVRFLGASGGLVIESQDQENQMMLKQSVFQEVDSNGDAVSGPGKTWNVAGGNNQWTDPADQGDGLYSTTFSVTEGTNDFELVVGFTTGSDEKGLDLETRGGCDPQSMAAMNSDGACVKVPPNSLEYGLVLTGWNFNEDNTDGGLTYTISVTGDGSTGSGLPEQASDQAERKASVKFDYGDLEFNNFVTIDGVETTIEEPTVTEGADDGTYDITFNLPTFAAGQTLIFDPTMTLNSPASWLAPSALFMAIAALF